MVLLTLIVFTTQNAFAQTEVKIVGDTNPMYGGSGKFLITIEGELQNKGAVEIELYDDLFVWEQKIVYVTKGNPNYSYEYNLNKISGSPGDIFYLVITNGDANASISFTVAGSETSASLGGGVTEKKLIVEGWVPKPAADNWLVRITFCPGDDKISRDPMITITTDLEEYHEQFGKLVMPFSCGDQLIDVKAKDPQSIRAFFTDNDDFLGNDITSLKNEIAELKETIKKKDAVLMEQLKVISQLAQMVKNVVFENMSKFFNFLI